MTQAVATAARGRAVAQKPWLPFEELVQAHVAWQSATNGEAERAYRAKLAAFEEHFGEIVDSYWCSKIASAVALTERSTRLPGRLRGVAPELEFHRVSDWATRNEPDVAALLHKCDQLAIKITRILRGPTRSIAMRLVMSSASHVLSLVDQPAEHRSDADKAKAIAYETEQLETAEEYYEEVGLRQAQLVYFGGMILGALLIAGVSAAIWLALGHDTRNRELLAAVMGAAGALLSVMARMNNRKQGFELDYELGRLPLVVLGIFRPLTGAAFGLVVNAALVSGIVSLQLKGGDGHQRYFYALLAFVGGWSERLAKDILDSAELTVGAKIKARHAPANGRRSHQA